MTVLIPYWHCSNWL